MKRIALISGDVTDGITYIRGHMALRHLRGQYDFHHWSYNELDHAKLIYMDAIIMFHPYHDQQLQLVHRSKFHYRVPIIVDADDLLNNLPTDHPSYAAFKGNKVEDIMRLADHVTVSTDRLAKEYRPFNRNITVIENCIDPDRYGKFDVKTKPYHSGFVVGWTGSSTHLPDIYMTGFVEGLARAMRKNEEIRAYFHLLCPQSLVDEFGSRVVYNSAACDYMDYPGLTYTYPFDVCCVPLQDHPFNHAKSDLRLLDMAPFEIPILASPVTEFKRHDCVRLVEDWEKEILWAAENKSELERLALAAKEYVYKERTVEGVVARWKAVIDSLWE